MDEFFLLLLFVVFVLIVFLVAQNPQQFKSAFASASSSANKAHGGFGSERFRTFVDKYKTIAEVQQALRDAGLESSNLIVGIDYTKSNEWTGARTFGGRCLHDLSGWTQAEDLGPGSTRSKGRSAGGGRMNPYQRAIAIIGETLESFDDDKLIPAFGFGDSISTDKKVFSINPKDAQGVCYGFQNVLECYCSITPSVTLSGPTSFAPLIYRAIEIVKETKSYHILLIIADGQVTNPKATADAIVAASKFPISIIMVGVGDGPWDQMSSFDDDLPERQFDNFQFVNFAQLMNAYSELDSTATAAAFSLTALMEIPEQYKSIRQLGMLG